MTRPATVSAAQRRVRRRGSKRAVGVPTRRREGGITDIHKLTNGPARLTQALGIKDTSLSGQKLLNMLSNYDQLSGVQAQSRTIRRQVDQCADIFLEPPQKPVKTQDITTSPRIGIRQATDAPWRFYLKDNSFVSKHPKARHLGL